MCGLDLAKKNGHRFNNGLQERLAIDYLLYFPPG